MKPQKVASGILPIAESTKQICLAWRSPEIRDGDRFGVIGGMVKDDLNLDEADNAVIEMIEETGYCGAIQLHPAFLYQRRGFRYHNFIGIVPEPFSFNPQPEFAFETSFLRWLPYQEALWLASHWPKVMHQGLVTLLFESRELIERFT